VAGLRPEWDGRARVVAVLKAVASHRTSIKAWGVGAKFSLVGEMELFIVCGLQIPALRRLLMNGHIWKAGRAAAVVLAVCLILPMEARTAGQGMQKQPAPEMAKLKFLLGDWTYESVYEKSDMVPNGGKTKGTYKAVAGPGGFSQIVDFTEAAPEGEEIGHEVTVWDAKASVYKSYVFGNGFSGPVIQTGHWDGDKLVFDSEFGTMKLQSVQQANADGTVKISESYKTGDGDWKVIFTGVAKKVS
jgi:hypothetical protein